MCRKERQAYALGYLLVFAALSLAPLFGLIYHLANPGLEFNQGFLVPSPMFACFGAFELYYGVHGRQFWSSCALTHLYGWLFLVLACAILPQSWQEKTEAVRPGGKSSREARRRVREKRLEANPFWWLASRGRRGPVLIFVLPLLAWSWGLLADRAEWLSIPYFLFTMLFFHVALKLLVATESTRMFYEERKSGTFELLLTTPVGVQEMIAGQVRALWGQFGPTFLFVLLLDVVFLSSEAGERDFLLFWGCLVGTFVSDLVVIPWIGMAQALRAKSSMTAASSTIFRVLILPWVVFVGAMIFMETTGVRPFRGDDSIAWFWVLLNLGIGGAFAVHAFRLVSLKLRQIVSVGKAEEKNVPALRITSRDVPEVCSTVSRG